MIGIPLLMRHLRATKGWTMADLARASSLTQSEISLIERDKRSPRLDTLVKIAGAFDLTLSQFLDNINSIPIIEEILKESK